ncbi:murein biosynthesis integral membrane protein MurJ [Bizionia myxarmorum]|uniref:Virulence factor MviN n=1 Tax=Bizionia myxarmorum TaxID=291186 RepID=A0A5D0R3V1_9FLAO|nr:lipid II flippase MurJ [Bizionia myxarmorum]TYB76237.1 virulence factor MviN [Bizionia myxarmorum]
MKITHVIKNLYNKVRHNSTAANIIIVGVITVLVKFFGFYKEVVIAGEFGLSELLDTFFIALLLPGFINEVFLSAFNSVFIPNYIAEEKTNKNIAAFQSTSFAVTIVTSLVFMLIAYLFTDVFLELFFGGHTSSYYNLIITQFHYLLPCILIWGLTSLISGLLNIYGEFTYSSLYPIITSIVMIICVVFYRDELGTSVLAIGMLIGSVLQLLFLAAIALKKRILKLASPDFKSANAILMFKQVPAKVSSGFLTGLIPVTDQYFAAQLIVGSIAALNYGMKIPAFFTTIFIIALGNVLLPYFSKMTIDNPEKSFKTLYLLNKWIFIVIMSIMVIASIFSREIVALLFERDSFTADDTAIVSQIQIIYLIGVPFIICGNLFVKFLTSINKNAFMAYVSLGSMLLNIILDFILMKWIGLIGIALCTTIIQVLKIFVFYNYTNKQKQLLTS